MEVTHRGRVKALLAGAAAEHASLMSHLSPELQASVPVDSQGVTQAIDHLATAAGLSLSERRALIRPHAVNPAVLHARVFGRAPLARETVIASFVDGARVRADPLADVIGGEPLGQEVRRLLVEYPPPVDPDEADVVSRSAGHLCGPGTRCRHDCREPRWRLASAHTPAGPTC